MAIKENFSIPRSYRMWSLGLMGVGVLSVIIGYIMYGHDEHHGARFWSTLLYNSTFFLLVCNAAMFFITATTLAWGGWQISFRRVSEAISTCVPVIGVITFIILMGNEQDNDRKQSHCH